MNPGLHYLLIRRLPGALRRMRRKYSGRDGKIGCLSRQTRGNFEALSIVERVCFQINAEAPTFC